MVDRVVHTVVAGTLILGVFVRHQVHASRNVFTDNRMNHFFFQVFHLHSAKLSVARSIFPLTVALPTPPRPCCLRLEACLLLSLLPANVISRARCSGQLPVKDFVVAAIPFLV